MPLPADAAPSFLWLPELPDPPGELDLDGEDAHFVARVCRALPGDTLTATDGRGTLASLCVLASRGEVRVRIESRTRARDPGHAVIGCGAPEGQRADWLVEKLAELGVRVLQPLETRRGSWERFEARRDRLERLAIAALKQSRQAFALEIRAPLPVESWVAALPAAPERWLADPDGEPADRVGAGSESVAAVGPAGGFDPGELGTLRAGGFAPVRLGVGRLRAETAAVAWASQWSSRRAGA
jgi:16S rRNA (uracil1498-N3)-methyltransferase